MLFKNAQRTAASLAMLAAVSAATDAITVFKEGNDPTSLMEAFDYSVVSFYNSEEWSTEVDKIMEGSKAHFEKQIADGVWAERNVGWFRVDIEKHPELSYDDSGIPDQLVVNRHSGLRRYLHYELSLGADKQNEEEEHFALIIKELTGDFFLEIACEDIQAEQRFYYDEVLYFGAKEDLMEGGSADLLVQIAMVDRYNYDH